MINILYFIIFISINILSVFSGTVLLLSYGTVAIFLSWLIYLYNRNKVFFISHIYIFYAITSTLIVSIFLEHGVYLIEINTLSHSTNLPIKASFQVFCFIVGSLFIFKTLLKSNLIVVNLTANSNLIIRIFFYLLTIFFIGVLFVIASIYGTPLSHGVHRNDYWTFYAPSWGAIPTYWLMQLTFIFGYFYSKYKQKYDIYFFLGSLITIFLMGERFTGLLYSLVFFSIPLLLTNTQIQLKLSSTKKIIFVCSSIFFISFALYNSFIKSQSSLNPLEQVLMRSSLQSQMWWALEKKAEISPKSSDVILKNYFGWGIAERYSGVYYLMDQVSDQSIVNDRYESNSRFTMSGFINNIYIFGYIFGTFVNFLWGLIFGLITYCFYIGIKSLNIIYVFISFKLLFKIQATLLNGSIPDLFSLETLIFLSMLIFFLRFSQTQITHFDPMKNN